MRRALLFVVLFLALAPAARAETLSYRFGPIHVAPGQNTIEFAGNDLKPPVDGWITGFKPNLTYENGAVPRVDVVHLHHGVWLSNFAPLFAAGEEKTIISSPPGYGWRYRTSDAWVMNHMIHNLTPTPADVYIDYELEFARDGTPEAAAMQEVRTLWMDVRNFSFYPVFDVHRGAGGRDGRYTFPDESRQRRNYTRHRMTLQEDGVLVGTGGHLHPGGLWTDLYLERGGRKVRLFRSRAKYFEPAGAVSWDVAMEVTPPEWRVGEAAEGAAVVAVLGQVEDLENRLPQYAWHGVGRADGKQGGEYSPIFYLRDRFEVREEGTFWLSETPDNAGSVGWDAALPRIVTWVLLEDETDGNGQRSLLVLNTHFDHRGVTARQRSAELIVEKLAELPSADAVVVMGDFNFLPDTPPYEVLDGHEVANGGFQLRDAIAISASEPTGPDSTWNAFRQIAPGRRIDFVFVGGNLQVASHDILDPRHEGRFLSDHLPVRVDLKWE
jgi:endonuclease/exonuclease/phosphatase family metal-dependent hydrolase